MLPGRQEYRRACGPGRCPLEDLRRDAGGGVGGDHHVAFLLAGDLRREVSAGGLAAVLSLPAEVALQQGLPGPGNVSERRGGAPDRRR
jgi:hypothetical protein